MKRFLTMVMVVVMLALTAATSFADVSVRGYFRQDGTYVRPHMRSNPDGNFNNNWSTYPNINPYTGKRGTKLSPDLDRYPHINPYTGKMGTKRTPDLDRYLLRTRPVPLDTEGSGNAWSFDSKW